MLGTDTAASESTDPMDQRALPSEIYQGQKCYQSSNYPYVHRTLAVFKFALSILLLSWDEKFPDCRTTAE